MNDQQIKRIIEDDYDDSNEDTIRSMVSEFYSRRMLSIAIVVWVFAVIFCAGAVYSGVRFSYSEQTKSQIMYAALFIVFVEGIALMKIFAWQMLARNSVKREIKRLELRIVELGKSLAENTRRAQG